MSRDYLDGLNAGLEAAAQIIEKWACHMDQDTMKPFLGPRNPHDKSGLAYLPTLRGMKNV